MARTLTARVTELRSRSGLLDVLWRTVDEARIDGQRRLGAEITYYAFFSLFPLLMVFVTLMEAVFGKKTSEEIVKSVLGQFPVVGADIVDNIATPQGRGFAARGRHRARPVGGLARVRVLRARHPRHLGRPGRRAHPLRQEPALGVRPHGRSSAAPSS